VNKKGQLASSFGIEKQGINTTGDVLWNLDASQLIKISTSLGEGKLSKDGALVCLTGQHTGRSPKDKFIVKDDITHEFIDWGSVNVPMDTNDFDLLYQKMLNHLSAKDLFVQDCYVAADDQNRLCVRIVNETAWHNLFARNMFIQPDKKDLESFRPDFTILHAPSCCAEPEIHRTNSEVFVIINFSKKLIIIGGTVYAGEIKKSVFSLMNFILPGRGILPMHCSANISAEGETAIFFGLSGTGKTTLSADASRVLIGDDEHGWGDKGVFNFEGGCYAKVIKLSKEAEPEIYEATKMFGTILENVVMGSDGDLDLNDSSLTENTRASYPIDFIPNTSKTGHGPMPKHVIMLTADAFGVLPPISKLTSDQAMYHFLSGYTAKVAGTEKGIKEPQAAFSSCFGAPFMPRSPTVYAELLGKKIEETGASCWLVNTGWSGGGYGVGERMPIKYTRAMLNAALNGELDDKKFIQEPFFGLMVPESCPNVPNELLEPRLTWHDDSAYQKAAEEVARRFEKNFKKFENFVSSDVMDCAIRSV